MLKSYGGYTWTSQEPYPVHPESSRALGLTGLAVLGAAGAYGATRTLESGYRPVDYIAGAARLGGNLSPFQLLNTFRAPELLSPWLSNKYRGEGLAGFGEWGKEFLGSDSTHDWLKYATGLSSDELASRGVTRGMIGDEAKIAEKLTWTHTAGSKGELHAVLPSKPAFDPKLAATRLAQAKERYGQHQIEMEAHPLYKLATEGRHAPGLSNTTPDDYVAARSWYNSQLDAEKPLYNELNEASRILHNQTPNTTRAERHLLSKDISLFAMNEETINPFTDKKGLNRAAAAQFAAADMYTKPGFSEADVFARGAVYNEGKEVVGRSVSAFMPGPSMHGSVESLADIGRRTNWLRSIPAFEMGRFNTLLGTVTEQFGGDLGTKFFKDVLKVGPGVRPGPASHMFARYGMLAAGAGALILGNEQLDWIRRKNTVGHLAVSAGVAGGASYLSSRLGAKSKTAFMIGVGAFFGQTLLPGFNEGLMPGLATTGANADILRANMMNPVNYYRRTLEGFAPGISDWKTGALLSIGAVTAAGLTLPGMKERLNVKMARMLKHPMLNEIALQNRSIKDIYYQNIGRELNMAPEDTYGFLRRKALIGQYHARDPQDPLSRTRALNRLWTQSEEQFGEIKKLNPLNTKLRDQLAGIAKQHPGGGMDTLMREIKGFRAETVANFFGADLHRDKVLLDEVRGLGFGSKGLTSRMGRLGAVGLAAFGAHQLLTGGLLGSMETADELREVYSGKKMVEMKKSRWWEAGGTPFEGGETTYFRPHAYALMMNRVREKGIWGANEDERSPIGKFFTKNFTYDLEKETYWDRPYPMSSAAFSDIPIIGGVLGASIGQLIKPPKLMHTGEWMREGPNGSTEFANVFKGGFTEPAFELGAIGTGKPISPFDARVLHSDITHQANELAGMTGWAKSAIGKTIFGSENWSSDQARIATAGEMTSWSNQFWEAQMGGGFFSNEFLRRIFPRQQSEIKKYNPLMNSMPSWIPDKYHYGDPYRAVEWGEARLPGAGFAALHPELAGVDPEAYPLLYKYQILADISPLTPEFYGAQQSIYKQRQAGLLTAKEIDWIDRIDSNRSKVINKLSYKDLPDGAIGLPGSGLTRSLWHTGQSALSAIAAPAEYMIPMGFRPIQKLLGGNRDAIQQYEYDRLYGTPLAFWDKPVRDWFRPAFYSSLHLLGYDGKPAWRADADATGDYFDKLQFVKYMQLADDAAKGGDGRMAAQYRWQASQTRVGVNPQGSPLSIYWAMAPEERPYFNSFVQAKDNEERKRILEMVPGDQAHLYQALWSRMDSGDTSLFTTSSSTDEAYMGAQLGQVQKELASAPMPSQDWIGWHGDVELSDVKVRYAERTGADVHDYGLWESDVRKSASQPFLEGSEDFLFQGKGLRFSNVRSEVYNMLGSSLRGPQMSYNVMPGTHPQANIIFNDNRDGEIRDSLQRYMTNGY